MSTFLACYLTFISVLATLTLSFCLYLYFRFKNLSLEFSHRQVAVDTKMIHLKKEIRDELTELYVNTKKIQESSRWDNLKEAFKPYSAGKE